VFQGDSPNFAGSPPAFRLPRREVTRDLRLLGEGVGVEVPEDESRLVRFESDRC